MCGFDTRDGEHDSSDASRDASNADAADVDAEEVDRTRGDDPADDVVRIIEGHAVQFNEYRY